MKTKLTLTVETSTIEKAKLYAKNTGRSLSGLIENYLEYLTQDDFDRKEISARLTRIIGSVKLPEDFCEKRD
ncbi:MAG TPA: hypothetical protein DIT07_04020 [Sphingobacteriaceae bacterium]|nr:hypothetical protein [Sphingobacteriaceae bacterium]